MRLTLRVKKINQLLFPKLWYIDQIYTIPKYKKMIISTMKLNEYTISSAKEEICDLQGT